MCAERLTHVLIVFVGAACGEAKRRSCHSSLRQVQISRGCREREAQRVQQNRIPPPPGDVAHTLVALYSLQKHAAVLLSSYFLCEHVVVHPNESQSSCVFT